MVRGDDNIAALPKISDEPRMHREPEGFETYLNQKNKGCMCILLMAIMVCRMLTMLNML